MIALVSGWWCVAFRIFQACKSKHCVVDFGMCWCRGRGVDQITGPTGKPKQ